MDKKTAEIMQREIRLEVCYLNQNIPLSTTASFRSGTYYEYQGPKIMVPSASKQLRPIRNVRH